MLSGFDERGQAIQIGAVLLFGVLVIAFAGYQAFVVPNQNKQVEFNHNQQVQQQLQDLRNGAVSIPGGGSGRSVSVQLGTQYPSRVVALNPGPPSGSLRTAGTTNPAVNFSVLNARTDGETGDFWNGDSRNYSSGSLVYAPNYNEYEGAPRTVYENTVLFNTDRGRNLTRTDQRLIDDRTVSLVSLNGSLSVSQSSSVAVDLEAVSTSTRTVAVENASADENVTVSVPTQLDENAWRDLLAPELVENGGYVYDISSEPIDGSRFRRLSIRLEPNVEYTLRLTRVGVGTGVREPSEAYLTTVSGNGSAVPEGSTQRLVVEVRDSFNNPVSGVSVNASTNLSSVQPSEDTTDADGQIAFTYEAPSDIDGDPKSVAVNLSTVADPATRPPFDRETVDNASFSLTVRNTDGSGTGGSGISGNVVYNGDAVNADGPLDDGVPAGVNFSITNQHDQSIEITEIEIDPTNPDIEVLSDDVGAPNDQIARTEVYVDGATSDAYVDYNFGVGLPVSTNLNVDGFSNNGNAETPAGGTATVYLYEFEDGDGEVNMTGEDVDITVTYRFSNGLLGESTFTVTPTFSGAGGGGSGDTTPPTVSSASATAESIDTNDNKVDQVDFAFDTSDNTAVDRVELRVFDNGGGQIGSATVNSPSSSSEIVTFGSQNLNNKQVSVRITTFDTSGNSRTCTGSIGTVGGTISDGSGLDCSQTSP